MKNLSPILADLAIQKGRLSALVTEQARHYRFAFEGMAPSDNAEEASLLSYQLLAEEIKNTTNAIFKLKDSLL